MLLMGMSGRHAWSCRNQLCAPAVRKTGQDQPDFILTPPLCDMSSRIKLFFDLDHANLGDFCLIYADLHLPASLERISPKAAGMLRSRRADDACTRGRISGQNAAWLLSGFE